MLVLSLALALAPQATAAPATNEIGDLQLAVTPPALEGLSAQLSGPEEDVRGVWTGRLAACEVQIVLHTFELGEWGFQEPGGVSVVMVDWLRQHGEFDVDSAFENEGRYGSAPILAVVHGPLRDAGNVVGEQYVASGLLPTHGYAFQVRLVPAPDEAARQSILAFFHTGIAYAGPVRDPSWTNEEALARWVADVPPALHEEFRRNLAKKNWVEKAILRTEHYLVMTNASGGKKFAQQLEKNYTTIGKLFPLPSGKGCRLMPVFLFQTPEEYYDFCVKLGMTRDEAERSKGHAYRDYYATWYESPTDPTHLHEQVHQIFANRLFLGGGGSWFQEGVAEYAESSRNDRNVIASQVAKGRSVSLADLFARESLLWSSAEDRKEGGSEASDLYTLAALFIEFLRESRWGKERFPRFLEVVGRAPETLEKVRAAFQDVYGADLGEVEKQFRAYCDER